MTLKDISDFFDNIDKKYYSLMWFALLLNLIIMMIFSYKTPDVKKCIYNINNDENLINSCDDIKDKIIDYNTKMNECLEKKKQLIIDYNNSENKRNKDLDNTYIAIYINLGLLFGPMVINKILKLFIK